ncbi:hypothetical protein Barb6XT_01305 [Bacteroidales bacterium Barb6XT]|nr:hypothetical protein Barb6XT_01305 [Bacteroidales bacterium Barb6XT]
MVYNAIYIIRSSFQDFLIGITINPTFRFASCGAEIFCPFGTPASYNSLIKKNNMPITTLQKVAFALLMSFMMVFGMESYNHIIAANVISLNMFAIPFFELCWLMTVVIALETLFAGRLARALAFRFVSRENNRPITIILAIQFSTVLLMCPMMSLVATLIFKNGLSGNLLSIWLKTIAVNFPIALLWQVLIAGPVVRFAVNKITN